jgi:class III poly(R)-hydroxyalkanoic acid synthase PhaE subunit
MNWGSMLSDFWGPMADNWGDMFTKNFGGELPGMKGRWGESVQATTKVWKSLFGAMKEPEALETFQKATQVTPDLVMGFAQSCLKGFANYQGRVQEWIQKRSQAEDPIDIQALDKEFIRQWNEAYEKEFSRYLKMPQIGLTRFYQERALNAADKYNLFQGVLSEFLHMLYLPMEKAFTSLQDKMSEMTEEGPLDEKSKTYYNLWIKLLEGHYMELFKQPEFGQSLSRTLEALEDYQTARQAVIDDLLKMHAIPTQNDLDDLYKEIYVLKKRMRVYEKNKRK